MEYREGGVIGIGVEECRGRGRSVHMCSVCVGVYGSVVNAWECECRVCEHERDLMQSQKLVTEIIYFLNNLLHQKAENSDAVCLKEHQ